MEDSKLDMSTSSEPEGHQNLQNNGGEEQRHPQQHAGSLEHAESPNEGLSHADDSAAIAGEFSDKETPTLESNEEDDAASEDAGGEALDVKEEVGADVRPSKRSRIKVELGETVVHGGGEADVNCVVYKVGDQRQALVQLWKEHESLQGDEGIEASQNAPTLEVRIPAKHVTSTNRHVKSGRLWGTDVYTVDSDLVAVLMHIGYCRRTASPPSSATEELRVTVRVLAPQDCYISTVRNNVHSRAWRAPIDCSYRVERCCFVKQGGEIIDLDPCVQHSSNIEPTFVPVFLENKKITRAAALKALAQKRFLSSMRFLYSFSMEPWYEYSINIVADQGLKAPLYTSARLKKGEVLYVETLFGRYELCYDGEVITASPGPLGLNSEGSVVDVFRWSRCKRYLTQKHMLSVGVPLSLEYVEVLEEKLDWEDILWSHKGVIIAGKEYHLARALFFSPN